MLRSVLSRQLMMIAIALPATLAAGGAIAQRVSEGVPKQVHLIVEGNRLVASNIRASGFDELRLRARENVRDSVEGEAVLVVVTSQRILAYGVVSGWRAIDRVPNERIERVTAEDFAGLVVTSERMLNFNGESGVWGERERRVAR